MHDVFIEAGGCHLVPFPPSRVCLLGLQTFLEFSQGTLRHMPRQATTPIIINRWSSPRTKFCDRPTETSEVPEGPQPHRIGAPRNLRSRQSQLLTQSSDQGSSVGRHSLLNHPSSHKQILQGMCYMNSLFMSYHLLVANISMQPSLDISFVLQRNKLYNTYYQLEVIHLSL